MFNRIRRQSKEGVEISLGKIVGSALRGVGVLFGFAVDLEKAGKSEYRECGEIKGKTESGKDVKGAYDFHVKVGLRPEEFRDRKKLNKWIKMDKPLWP